MSAAREALRISRFYAFLSLNEIMRVWGALIDKPWLIVAPLVNPSNDKSIRGACYSTKSNFRVIWFYLTKLTPLNNLGEKMEQK